MDSPNVPAATAPPKPSRSGRRLLLVLVFVPCIAAAGFLIGSRFFPAAGVDAQPNSDTLEVRKPTGELPPELFKRWGGAKPDLAIVLSGQTFGYLQPCGCSEPQEGGLVRRYNLIQMLKKKGWTVTAVDLGDLAPVKKEGLHLLEPQSLEQYRIMLRAMNMMDYEVYGLGVLEMKMPLFSALAEAGNLNLAKPKPMTLNLDDPNKVFQTLDVQQYAVVDQGGVKVGLTSMVGASLQEKLKGIQGVKFIANDRFLPVALKQFAKDKVDVSILFLHSDYSQPNVFAPHADPKPDAEKCAQFCDKLLKKNDPAKPKDIVAPVDLIVYASYIDVAAAQFEQVPDPGAKNKMLDSPRLLTPGHKGKFVGVLGLFKKPAGGYEIKYELVKLGPEFGTPDAAIPTHPVMKLLEEYAETVKKRDFLDMYGKQFREEHKTQKELAGVALAKFVGSDRCGDCHGDEYKIWAKSKHAVAYDRGLLVKATHPSNRQFDPECVACHVTGFPYKTGFNDPPANATAKQKQKHFDILKNVGCETCHGPGSMHADNPMNPQFKALMNTLHVGNKGQNLKVDLFCQKCHDIENDVHWGNGRFEKAWKEIAHGKQAAANGNLQPAANPGRAGIAPAGGIDAPAEDRKSVPRP
jgi:hypothetical protein